MAGQGYVHAFQIDSGHTLHIYQGSLVGVEADALVSSDDNYLSAGGGVSRALANAAGFLVRMECQSLVSRQRPNLGDVVRTSAGALPCKYLYHAITINFDSNTYMDETALRRLVANLLDMATRDGVRSLGMPAIGSGAAGFNLGRASEIIVEELLIRLVDTPIERLVLALVGDNAEQLFYERLVRGQADRLASMALRRRETMPAETITAPPVDGAGAAPQPPPPNSTACVASIGERVEQFPNLVDENRLAAAEPGRPRLVEGLADLILRHADEADVQQELLSSPDYQHFRGTVKQRLMEFLYLSENNLRTALGALFTNKDLRRLVADLGQDNDLPRNQDELVATILRALCFNTLEPPLGINDFIRRIERSLANLRARPDKEAVLMAALEAGKTLEQMFKDLLRLYGFLFWSKDFEDQFVQRGLATARRDANLIDRLTIGQAREALEKLAVLMKKDAALRTLWLSLDRTIPGMIPELLPDPNGREIDVRQLLQDIIGLRNLTAHARPGDPTPEPGVVGVTLENFHAFLCTCQSQKFYPDVLRYEGSFENRNGERFVHFLDEKGQERKVRTDCKIDARHHYYCFANQ